MVKFRLPELSSDEEDVVNHTNTIVLPSDEENDDQDTSLKFTFKKHDRNLATKAQKEDEYSTLFINRTSSTSKRLISPKILNLDDLDKESEDALPPKSDIHQLAQKQGHFDVPQLRDRDYKKLLDTDDIQVLKDMRVINSRNKALSDNEDNVLTMEDNLNDERLTLTKRENQLAAKEKRQKIEYLLNAHKDAETEADILMDEMNQVERLTGRRMHTLVRLSEETSWEALNKSLADALQTHRESNALNDARLKSLESQIISLSNKQQELLQELTKIVT